MCDCSSYTEKLSNARKPECCLHTSPETPANPPKCYCLPNTVVSPKPLRRIRKRTNRIWPTGLTDAASKPLRPKPCNAPCQQCLPPSNLDTTISSCVFNRKIALCLPLPSAIHPPATHLLNQNIGHGFRIPPPFQYLANSDVC